jgi:hypothetical protein
MLERVAIQEDSKTVFLTRKHIGVRKRVEEAAKGNMHALRELLKLGRETDHIERKEQVVVFSLEEIRAVGRPLEDILNEENTVIIRQPKPKVGASASSSPSGKPARRRRRKSTEPHSQSFKALINFELGRRIRITDTATGSVTTLSIREVILKQLANAFAMGKRGAQALALRLTASAASDNRSNRKIHVWVPYDYQIPPKPEIPWPQRRELEIAASIAKRNAENS